MALQRHPQEDSEHPQPKLRKSAEAAQSADDIVRPFFSSLVKRVSSLKQTSPVPILSGALARATPSPTPWCQINNFFRQLGISFMLNFFLATELTANILLS